MKKGLFDVELMEAVEMGPETYQYFNSLINHRTIILNDEVSESIVENVIMPLRHFENDPSQEKVTLMLNTPGGSVIDGMVLCNIIDNYRKPLDIIVLGCAYSMGTIILCSGNRNPNVTKKCYPFSTGLIHAGSKYIWGESSVVEDTYEFQMELDKKVRKYIVDNTNISEEEYQKSARRQWFLSSSQLKECGLVDVIIGEDA